MPVAAGADFRSADDNVADVCPPSLRPAAVHDGVPVFEMRLPSVAGTSAPPCWGTRSATGRTVYVTLGTMFNDLAVFRVLLDGLAEIDCTVLATVGSDNDPALLEPLPANAIVERFTPQDEVLPHVEATVCHGGSGSTLAALAHGLPMLVSPRPQTSSRTQWSAEKSAQPSS